jgi:HAD superfamily hydrolase (TIGR01509 family)
MPGHDRAKAAALEAILFDVDGTLIDTTTMIVQTLGETYRRFLGVEVPPEEIKATIGMSLDVQVRLFDDRAHVRPDHGAMARFQVDLYEDHKHMEVPVPEALEAVRVCKRRGLRTAIVTSKDSREMSSVLPRLKLDGSLDTTVCATDTLRAKPDPEPALLALDRLGVAAERALLVGDTDYDMECGRAAGCAVAAVLWGAQPESRLAACEPDLVFRTPADLLRWCEAV